MKAIATSIAAIALLALVPTQSAAQDLGPTSTGTATIRVTIGPIAATLSAAQAGATGLWSFTSGRQGLMVNIPSTVTTGQTNSLSLYAVNAAPLRIRSSDLDVSQNGTSFDRGLNRVDFNLDLKSENSISGKAPVSLVIYNI